MAEKHSLTWRRKDNQVQNAQRVPNKVNSKRSTCRHIIIKITQLKDKEIILKAARKKQLITYKGNTIKLSADFSVETLQVIREWQDTLTVLKEESDNIENYNIPGKIFKIEGETVSYTSEN